MDTEKGGKTKKAAACSSCESFDISSLIDPTLVRARVDSSFPLWRVIAEQPDTSKDNNKSSFNSSKSILKLERSFIAQNFQAALDFVVACGAVAEKEGHHPDLHITGYRVVRVVLFTHSVKGVTENDFIVAKLLDSLPVKYSPKWEKTHITTATKE